MKRRFGLLAFGLAVFGLGQPATAKDQDITVKRSTDGCSIEVRGEDRARMMRSNADGNAEIGLMFAEPAATPGRTRDGYFYLGFDTSTSGPMR